MITIDEMVLKYDELQLLNHYGELLEEMAKDFKLNSLKTIFESINTIHDIEGHMQHDLREVRERFKNEMKAHLKEALSSEYYEVVESYI